MLTRMKGGEAVADVLYGKVNPCGKLPITFYKNSEQLGDFEDYNMAGRTYRYMKNDKPLYPFGYGLSYTDFEIGNATLSADKITKGQTVTMTIPVTNKGKKDGTEVVQVYVKNPSDHNGPIKQLRAYKYGKEKGVYLYLWYNSNGIWNDAPQTPRNCMSTAYRRQQEMEWMQSIGIRGIKVDFFGGDKQCTMELYRDILMDAMKHNILVIFHGCTLPRGWEYLFPNYVASEAVRASENLHFGQNECDREAMDATFRSTLLTPSRGSRYISSLWGGKL